MSDQTQDRRIAMTQVQAARALGVSDRTIRNWTKQGLICGKRVGGVVLYAVEDLRRLAGVTGGSDENK